LFIKFNYIDEEFEYMGRSELLEFVKILWFESVNKGPCQMCIVFLFNFIRIFLLLGLHYVAFGRRCLLIQPTKLFLNVDILMLLSLCGKKVEAMHWLNIFNMWSGIMNYKVVHIYITIIYCITSKGDIHDLYIFVTMTKF